MRAPERRGKERDLARLSAACWDAFAASRNVRAGGAIDPCVLASFDIPRRSRRPIPSVLVVELPTGRVARFAGTFFANNPRWRTASSGPLRRRVDAKSNRGRKWPFVCSETQGRVFPAISLHVAGTDTLCGAGDAFVWKCLEQGLNGTTSFNSPLIRQRVRLAFKWEKISIARVPTPVVIPFAFRGGICLG